MSFTLIPPTASLFGGYSSPGEVSICAQDDGSGGTVHLNGLGIGSGTLADAVDLKTFFTSNSVNFQSIPLLSAFKLVTGVTYNALNVMNQLIRGLDVSVVPISTQPVGAPSIGYLAPGPTGVPYLDLNGPAVAGVWRFTIKLRHSLTA
jgi:hypothetical protein